MRAPVRTLVSLGVVGSATAAMVLLLPGAAPPAAAAGLTPYSGCDALLGHYRAALRETATPYGWGFGGYGRMLDGGPMFAAATPMAASPVQRSGAAESATGGAVGSGATGTNLQEQGVDEPDRAKTARGLLLVVAQGKLQVLRTGAQPKQLASLPLGLGEQTYGGELLLSGDRALVMVPGWRQEPSGSASMRMGWGGGTPLTRAVLVDLADPAEPKAIERMELDGRYLSARLVDGRVRLVTTSAARPESTYPKGQGKAAESAALAANLQAAGEVSLGEVLPRLRRTAPDGTVRADAPAVGCTGVSRAEEPRGASTLLVTTLDPEADLEPVDTTAVTTDGDLVYASSDRLYVATSRWGTVAPAASDGTASTPTRSRDDVTTELHAFDTTADDVRYVGTGSVPGYVMGRWALSEHEGRLRVAVTSAPPWQQQEASVSSLHVLGESAGELVTIGKVGGMGKGERIQAVRYFGDLATVVTFRQTDPLYVLDLADPADPRVVGELKVPGFSTYLHPVGHDLLLGVGMDADEKTGRVTGMQLSTFDLSDRRRPRQVDRLSLGQGWSPATDDSRAFGYDPERRHALLPFTDYRGGSGVALGVRVGADGQLSEAGRLDLAAGFMAERVLHDADHVYAVNEQGVGTGSAADLERTASLSW